MGTWIALLRGVNVGGITIRSAELRDCFAELGFEQVRTVLASGNVAFEADAEGAAAERRLKERIEAGLSERFGYEAWIVLCSRERLAEIVAAFPFDASREGWHPYVLFASDPAPIAELLAAAPTLDPADESIAAGEQVVYWHCRRAVGIDSAFSKLVAKARFKPTTTNRNLRTLQKLLT
ncbi:DUF1697 domain-containing protein [Agromyces mediolanus]|uniref:DUF1697 domain-containing protein n=1 Tax=Agromyces mediolanus TaxID=41986 RepID=UPI0038347E65